MALKLDRAVSTRYLSKDLTAGNEHERRLQRTQVRGERLQQGPCCVRAGRRSKRDVLLVG